jgi:HlyD family secretion protein
MEFSMIRFIALFMLLMMGCSDQNDQFIYYGRLDADVIRISAQVGEIIDSLTVDEGMSVQQGQLLALINTDKLEAKRIQQMAQLEELEENIRALEAQINQIDAQLHFAEQNLQKTKRMVASGAATENKM